MRKYVPAAVLILLLIVFFSMNVQAEEIVEEIIIEGNENISEQRIRENISTEPGDEYVREKLREDMEAVYDMGYFDDVNVSFSSGPEGLQAIFTVDEFPRISKMEVTGLDEIYSQDELEEILGVSEGEVLNVNRMNSGLRDLNFKFQEDGYIMARVDDVNISAEGELVLTGNPGYLNDIVLEGNEKTRDYVIMRELDLEKDEPLNQRDIEIAVQSLFALEFFQDIYPDLRPVDEVENRADLVLEMEEANTGSLNFGAGYHSQDGLFGFVDLEERNLFGRGQKVGLELRFGDQSHYRFNFEDPRIFGTHLSAGFDIYQEERLDTRVRGLDTSLDYPLTDKWTAGTTLSYSQDLEEDLSSHKVTGRVTRDTRDHPFFPTDGGYNRISLETAGYLLGGDVDFLKLRNDNRAFFPGYLDDHAVAMRFQTGLSNTELPTHEQFSIGDADTLRGYSRMSGDNMVLFNMEYRFEIIDNVQGAGFYDYGKVWDHDESVPFLYDLQRGVGAGVRVETPIGQVRLDYAFNEDWSGTPHLGFGQTF